MIGQIVMALAVMACPDWLCGWPFTMATTATTGSDDAMVPAAFLRLNGMGVPVTGMLILCGVQTLVACSTISPKPADRSVVTNAITAFFMQTVMPE